MMTLDQTIFTKENFKKAEAWVLSIAFGLYMLSLFAESRGTELRFAPEEYLQYNMHFNYFSNYFIPMIFEGLIVYVAFMLMVLYIEPQWEKKKSVWLSGMMIFILTFSTAMGLSIFDTYLDAWRFGMYGSLQTAYNHIFFDCFVLVGVTTMGYVFYYLLKLVLTATLSKVEWKKKANSKDLYKLLVGGTIWLMVFMCFIIFHERLMAIVWLVVVPYSALIIILNVYWLIPNAEAKKFFHSSYIWKLILVVLVLDMIASMLFIPVRHMSTDDVFVMFILILCWTAVALIPWSWFLYKNYADKTQLVTALGKSDASLSFLKSQINPHFLFNALNTLYGTALQENADRTGEGIQKLGDMMRFMLQENMQDYISLTRDIEYLNNYIALQKLRTSRTADIRIETEIEEQFNSLKIAPMLLIPFVENAFKHGISLQQPSHIKITLQTKDNTLYFDVHNSIYIKPDNDPEKLQSGIGLQNVKERLALMYPNRHELIIRESAKEFFIHLTIQL